MAHPPTRFPDIIHLNTSRIADRSAAGVERFYKLAQVGEIAGVGFDFNVRGQWVIFYDSAFFW